MTDVSVIIVSWNTRTLLQDCLRSVYEQPGELGFEVIVIDNASTDGSVEMVKTDFPQASLIENCENRGFAAANNQGIAAAKGRYVLLLNSDTIVLDNAIGKAAAFAESHPEAAVVGCRVLNADRTLQRTCFMFPSILNMLLSSTYLYKLLPRSRFFGREQMTWWDRDDVRQVDVVTGCFMLVRRQAVEQVGPMDEQFFVYGEETDWCYRFKRAGWKALFTPEAEIVHLGGQSSRQAPLEMSLQLRASVLQFMHKHHGRLKYKAACVLVWLFFAVRVPVWLLRFVVKRTDYSQMRLKTYLAGMFRLISSGYRGLCARGDGLRRKP